MNCHNIILNYIQNCEKNETIFIDELDFKELEREAYEEAEKVKEFWKPTNSPKLIHFCYVR